MQITIPELSLVLLVGPSGCGKSTFARRHFRPSEIVSSDHFRSVVCDDEGEQAASRDAFELLHHVLSKRLTWRRLTVVDATNLQADARKPLLEMARRYHYLISAIVFDFPEEQCQKHNAQRPDRTVPARVIATHSNLLRKAIGALDREGVRKVYTLSSVEQADAVTIRRVPMRFDHRGDRGPFDIIGDVHGCFEELLSLLERLDYRLCNQPDERGLPGVVAIPPAGRKAVFVGDLGDRGPDTPAVFRLVMNMVKAGHALMVLGNHDNKLVRKLRGNEVSLSHGLALTMEQLEGEYPEFREQILDFLEGTPDHLLLDGGKLVVAHAGLREDLQGRASGRVRSFALFGDTTGEKDDHGLPVRLDWAGEYRGSALVVYGHTPVAEPAFRHNTINIDAGCVFGGRLAALRYPEKELVYVPAMKQYCEPGRPFLPVPGEAPEPLPPARAVDDGMLDLTDVLQNKTVETRIMGNVTVNEGNRLAALEVMSRFAVDPRWLIYLPPTMAPPESSKLPGLLEHPAEAFGYFSGQGVSQVVCQEKHMGSRAVVIVCRDEAAAKRAFGVTDQGFGVVLTRTGRRFFDGSEMELALLDRLRAALTKAGWWEKFSTDWVLLDAELMPWSAKAQELLKTQYAAVGASGSAALAEVVSMLGPLAPQGEDLAALASRYQGRSEALTQFVEAYRRYCWPVESVTDLKLAPFHLLATAGASHINRPHVWHMSELASLCVCDPEVLKATAWLIVDLADPKSVQQGIDWWLELTARGGEGMVVKPMDFVTRGKGLVQPAIKCRGREYLRIIYGPEYLADEHLTRLRKRNVSTKRGLALREFALGIEAIERFVAGDSLRRVHECCFAVLALESEAVDPRL